MYSAFSLGFWQLHSALDVLVIYQEKFQHFIFLLWLSWKGTSLDFAAFQTDSDDCRPVVNPGVHIETGWKYTEAIIIN